MNGIIDAAIDGAGRLITLNGTITAAYRSGVPGASGPARCEPA